MTIIPEAIILVFAKYNNRVRSAFSKYRTMTIIPECFSLCLQNNMIRSAFLELFLELLHASGS